MPITAKLDELGKPAWIALIVLGFMRTISYGKERPVAVCNDISCWSQNRRAVTVLGVSS